MQRFTFSTSRNAPLGDSVAETRSWVDQLHAALRSSSRPELADPLLSFDAKGEDVTVVLPDDGMQTAGELRESNPEALRQLRYAFRDWKNIVKEAVFHEASALTLTSDQLESLLQSENATLWAKKEGEEFQWTCCLGFRFGHHADNHLSDFAGDYAPTAVPPASEQTEEPATPTEKPPSQPMTPQDTLTPPPSPTPPPSKGGYDRDVWWRGKEHQAVLIFSCGFLLAAILGALYLRTNPCNTVDLERQIQEMHLQVDQRCNTPQP